MNRLLLNLLLLASLITFSWGLLRTDVAGTSSSEVAIGTDGAWTWYNDPRAVRFGDKSYFGGISRSGDVRVWQFDHASTSLRRFDLDSDFERDDHDNPAFLQLSDGRIVAFYSKHNGASYYRISTEPNSIASWGSRHTISTEANSYVNVFKLAGGRIYLFYRGVYPVNAEPHFRTTTEDELVRGIWSSPTRIMEAGDHRPYLKYRSDGRHSIYMTFTDGDNSIPANNIYFARFDTARGEFRKMDGSLIGTTASPWQVRDGEKVYDATVHQAGALTWDIALDSNHNPAIVYATFPAATGSSVPDHRYRYARWTGRQWVDTEITAAGTGIYYDAAAPANPLRSQPYYSCGVALDPGNPDIVYVARNNTAGRNCILEKWVTANNGNSWTSAAITTSGQNYRPYAVPGNNGTAWVGWFTGTYNSYVDYSTDIRIQRIP